MSASIKLKMVENCALGEVDTYTLTWKVSDAQEIDANIFVVEYTKPNPRVNKYDSEFHHVAYLPEMSSISTVLDHSAHQYIRQSSITRTYSSLERMEESKKVMLQDIQNLIQAYNSIGLDSKESEIVITEDGYTCVAIDNTTYTLDGETVTI
jgi:uncharacterized protein (UPF0335 family)